MGEDTLVDLAHLPRARDDAAAIDGPRDVVLGEEQLGGQLAGAVHRAPAVQREGLRDAVGSDPALRLVGGELESRLGLDVGEALLRRHRIDPARREEDDLGGAAPCVLEAVEGAREVDRDDDLAGTEHRRLRRAFDQRVDRADGGEVRGHADVGMRETNAGGLQAREVQLASLGGRDCRRRSRSHSACRSASARAMEEPMKPAPPVTSTR